MEARPSKVRQIGLAFDAVLYVNSRMVPLVHIETNTPSGSRSASRKPPNDLANLRRNGLALWFALFAADFSTTKCISRFLLHSTPHVSLHFPCSPQSYRESKHLPDEQANEDEEIVDKVRHVPFCTDRPHLRVSSKSGAAAAAAVEDS